MRLAFPLAVALGFGAAGCRQAPAPEVTLDALFAADASAAATDPELRVEQSEDAAPSESAKLKLAVSPPARGIVRWGRKKLGAFKPGHMVVEIERPRGSGPLEVTIRAEGFLPHHVRLFTDRDDKLYVRLYRPGEAPGLLGYRPGAGAAPPEGTGP